MIPVSKIKNDIPNWNAKHRYKVNKTVLRNGNIYQNITGFNTDPLLLVDWFLIEEKKFQNYVIVSALEDLPAISSGIYNLSENYTYFFINDLDLNGGRFVCGPNVVIMGSSSENVRITSTGLATDTALITSNYSLPIRFISFEHDTVFDLQGDELTTALDWIGVNINNSSSIGYIADYTNVIIKDSAFLNSGDLIFDGTIGTVGFDGCLIVTSNASTAGIVIPDTAVITRRFRIIYSAIVVGGGGIGISVDASATIPTEAYILDTVNFSGIGTYLNGLNHLSNKSLFVNNVGIQNSAIISNYTMNSNATVTTISSASTPVKVLGTTVNNTLTQKFDNSTSNKSIYTGALTRILKVSATLSVTGTNNDELSFYVYKNGISEPTSVGKGTISANNKSENIKIQTFISFEPDDYFEIYGENTTGARDFTVTDLNVIAD